MKPERVQAILQAFRLEHPGCLPVHVGGKGRAYHVIAQTDTGLELFTGLSPRNRPLDAGLPRLPGMAFGIPHGAFADVKVAHARRLTPPPPPGPLLPHLLAVHGPDLGRHSRYARLTERLRALIPEVDAQLAWEGLWRHLHVRGAITTGSLWQDPGGVAVVTHREAFKVGYESRGVSHEVGVPTFLDRFSPVKAGPPAPREAPKAWNAKWTNVT